jgi:hypothetical protein
MRSSRKFPSVNSTTIAISRRRISGISELSEDILRAWAKIFGCAGVIGFSVYGFVHWILK